MSRSVMPLNAIHSFLVTARYLNLTHAARELHLTQGAVSRKIAALESWLGFALFQRHARGLSLTERGATLLPELQQSYDQLLSVTEKARRPPQTLRLKAPTCIMRWLVPRLIAFEQRHPAIHVALTTTQEHHSRLDNFDAAIVYGTPAPDALRLFDERLTPVMGAGLAIPRQVDELAALTFLHPAEDRRDWQLWLQQQQIALPMQRNQHFTTMDLAISAAIQGFGITVADVTLIEHDIQAQRLVAPFPGSVATGAAYMLLRRQDSHTPSLLAELVEWLSSSQNEIHSVLPDDFAAVPASAGCSKGSAETG